MNAIVLPEFPRPDLPISHPENYPTLRLRFRRRHGLPDDGGLYLHDAITPGILNGYRGGITADTPERLTLEFDSVADAVAWADGITALGRDRSMVAFATPLATPYSPAVIHVNLKDQS